MAAEGGINETTNEALKKKWDSFSDMYEMMAEPSTTTLSLVLLNVIGIGNLGEKEHERIIDVCCGTGNGGKLFRAIRHNGNITLHSLDLSSKMIEKAKNKLEDDPTCHAQVGDALNLPFPDGYFTGYYSNLGLHLVPDYEIMLKEAYRVLSPNGKAAFSIWGKKENSHLMSLLPSVLHDLNIEIPNGSGGADGKVRSPFYMGSQSEEVIATMKRIGFKTVIMWSQPMILGPISADYFTEFTINADAALAAKLVEANQFDIVKAEIHRRASTCLENSSPLVLDIQFYFVTK